MGNPLWYWSHQHILQYIRKYRLQYPSIYGEIAERPDGTLYTTGEQRTGCAFCAFCAFGAQYDELPNRYQRMEQTHPAMHRFCIKNLGFGQVLDYLDVPYHNDPLACHGQTGSAPDNGHRTPVDLTGLPLFADIRAA